MATAAHAPHAKHAHGAGKTKVGSIYGVMAEFDTPADLYHAAEKIRDAGYSKWDCYSPFPMHGMEDAMGFKRTILPLIAFGGTLVGVGSALLMQFWMSAKDYPLVVQGKNPWDWEPFTPITFELGVLVTAFTILIGMLALNGLPRWYHPLMKKARFLRASDDKFFIAVEARDPKFHAEQTATLLQHLHATHVELVED